MSLHAHKTNGPALSKAKWLLLLAVCILTPSVLAAKGTKESVILMDPQILIQVSGFAGPESALWWEEGQYWILSNVAGSPSDRNGNGFLSLLDADGSLVERRWAGNMDAPKGMALENGKLWVTDISRVHCFRLVTGTGGNPATITLEETITIPGAVFLNDAVFLGNGRVAVSDTQGRAVYVIDGSEVTLLLKDIVLGNPNGLALQGDSLVMAQYYGNAESGGLWRLHSENGNPLKPVIRNLGMLDGLVVLSDGSFLVSDFSTGALFHVRRGQALEIWNGGNGTADIGWDPASRRLGVPNMTRGTFTLLQF